MTAPTLEEFLAAPPDPEEDETEAPAAPTPTAEVGQTAPRDSLASIADCLERIASVAEASAADAERPLQEAYEQLQRENRELEALHDTKQGLIEQALAILKPSTSKLANNLRSVLEPVVAAPEPEPSREPEANTDPPTPPADDAPIEDWVAFAQARGLEVDPGRTNRAQIRTALGIPQPIKPTGGGQ